MLELVTRRNLELLRAMDIFLYQELLIGKDGLPRS
jgi:hypothetical protein